MTGCARLCRRSVVCLTSNTEPAHKGCGPAELSLRTQSKESTIALQRVALGAPVVTLMTGSTLALAQLCGAKQPLGNMTCEDFLGIGDTIKPKMVY
jgi:hypothetical protein